MNTLSQEAHKDGHALHFQKLDLFSTDDDYIVGGRNGTVAYQAFGKDLAFKYRGEDDESQGGYESEPAPDLPSLDVVSQPTSKAKRKLIKKEKSTAPQLRAKRAHRLARRYV